MIKVLQKLISDKFTMEVLREIAKKEMGWESAVVKNIVMGAEPKKGDSYLSVVTKFTAEVTEGEGEGDEVHKIHLIAKGFPRNKARRATLRSEDFFRNEVAYYTKVWPALDAFQKTKCSVTPITAVPKCVAAHSDGYNDYVIMEDLSAQGFKPYTRKNYFKYTKALEVLHLFGKYHALSLALKDQKPEVFDAASEALEETYYAEKFRIWYRPIMSRVHVILRDAVQKELPEEYVNKLDQVYKEDLYGEAIKACHHCCEELGTISHGDCWTPNFLSKKNDEKTTEIKVIDYQIARCSSATMDLTFFLYVCVEPAVRNNRWDELINEYYCGLKTSLKAYGTDASGITIDLLKEHMRKDRHFTLLVSLESVIVSDLEDDDVADLDAIERPTTMDKVYNLKMVTDVEKRRNLADVFKHIHDHHFA